MDYARVTVPILTPKTLWSASIYPNSYFLMMAISLIFISQDYSHPKCNIHHMDNSLIMLSFPDEKSAHSHRVE